MTTKLKVFVLDDQIPKIPEFILKNVYASKISTDNLVFLTQNADWKSLRFLQQLLKNILSSREFIEGYIELSGYNHPSLCINDISNDNQPDVIIYDWEYDSYNPQISNDLLLNLLSVAPNAFVFIYSHVRDVIPPFLNKKEFDKFAGRMQLFKKGGRQDSIFTSEEFILQYILTKVNKVRAINIGGIKIEFTTNGYIKIPSDILFIEKIIGKEVLIEEIKAHTHSMDEKVIEQMIGKNIANILFEPVRGLLITLDSQILIDKFKPKITLTSVEVLKKYGLEKLKEVVEFGVAKII